MDALQLNTDAFEAGSVPLCLFAALFNIYKYLISSTTCEGSCVLLHIQCVVFDSVGQRASPLQHVDRRTERLLSGIIQHIHSLIWCLCVHELLLCQFMLSQEQQLMETHVKENYICILFFFLFVCWSSESTKLLTACWWIILLPPALPVFHLLDSCWWFTRKEERCVRGQRSASGTRVSSEYLKMMKLVNQAEQTVMCGWLHFKVTFTTIDRSPEDLNALLIGSVQTEYIQSSSRNTFVHSAPLTTRCVVTVTAALKLQTQRRRCINDFLNNKKQQFSSSI